MVNVSDLFYFFLFRGGGEGGGVRGGGRGGGGAPVFYKKVEGGGFSDEEEARQGERRRGNVCGEGGEGLNIFLRAEMPTKETTEKKLPKLAWILALNAAWIWRGIFGTENFKKELKKSGRFRDRIRDKIHSSFRLNWGPDSCRKIKNPRRAPTLVPSVFPHSGIVF